MTAIDQSFLAAQTAGDADLAAELLALFAGQCRRLMPGLADRTRGMGERADLAHTLKGSALGIGARAVGTLAGVVETALRQRSEPDADLAALDRAVTEALAEIGRAA